MGDAGGLTLLGAAGVELAYVRAADPDPGDAAGRYVVRASAVLGDPPAWADTYADLPTALVGLACVLRWLALDDPDAVLREDAAEGTPGAAAGRYAGYLDAEIHVG